MANVPLLASTSPKALWYLTRGSGVVSLLLLTNVVVLGIVTSMRWATASWPRFVVEGLHRNLALLSVVFLGVHIATSVIDGYVPIRWLDAVVPFGSAYRPLWLGLGALAFDLLLAVLVTSLVRVALGYRAWRAVHWLAYACWPIALLHSIGTGSDRATGWMLGIDGLAVCSVLLALGWMLTAAREPMTLAAATKPGSDHGRRR
jgi:predicted ferric reductase